MAYTYVDKICTIRLKLHKVLPAVYDESLSYLEGLSKLAYKLNEAIDATNALNDNVEVLNDSVTELGERVTTVEDEIEGFEAEITARIAELETNLTATINNAISEMESNVDTKLAEVDTKLSEVDSKIDALETYVAETIANLQREFHILINAEIERINQLYLSLEEELRQYVVDKVNEVIQNIPDLTNIYVKDPTTGETVKVQVAINNVFDFHLYNALTCDEFNELSLTCNELNTLKVDDMPRGFTVREWLHDAKKLLIKILPVSKIEKWLEPHSVEYGYLTGVKDWLYKNVDLNMSMWGWSGCFTCNELVTLGKTVDEIVSYEMTCDDYVLHGNTIMV